MIGELQENPILLLNFFENFVGRMHDFHCSMKFGVSNILRLNGNMHSFLLTCRRKIECTDMKHLAVSTVSDVLEQLPFLIWRGQVVKSEIAVFVPLGILMVRCAENGRRLILILGRLP